MKTVIFILVSLIVVIHGHGWLKDPPSRNSMWRYGFPTPTNWNDQELFCGGAFVMAGHGGKCGVCGDEYGKAQPHADGGKYAKGIIVRDYKEGQVIDLEVLLTTSHYGYFEFRVGDFSNKKTSGNGIGKLNGQLLELVSGGTQFKVTKKGQHLYKTQVRLPRGLTCSRCVFQWWYRGGNNWGCDQTGCGMGKGTQEHFVNCADVKIE